MALHAFWYIVSSFSFMLKYFIIHPCGFFFASLVVCVLFKFSHNNFQNIFVIDF